MKSEEFTPYQFSNFGFIQLPEVPIDIKYKVAEGLDPNCNNVDFFERLIWNAYERKKHLFKQDKLDQYKIQLQNEINIVKELDFIDYYLLVWMVINKTRELGSVPDAGRGSAVASIIFWLLGVTGVDPVDKGLIFSRFISKARAKKLIVNDVVYIKGDLAPDVDINIGGVRNEIINWLKEIYKGKIAKIANVSTYTGKMLIKDVAKTACGISEDEVKDLANMVERHAGIVDDLGRIVGKNPEFALWAEKNDRAFHIALKLRDVIKQKSSHASGYIISRYDLDGRIPLELNKEKELTVGYSKDDAANFSIKLDILGLTSDEIINDVLKHIPEKIEDIELDNNPLIYDQFQKENLLSYGLYQISADFPKRVLLKVKPKDIFGLSDVNAIARPGALAYLEDYVNNKRASWQRS